MMHLISCHFIQPKLVSVLLRKSSSSRMSSLYLKFPNADLISFTFSDLSTRITQSLQSGSVDMNEPESNNKYKQLLI